MFFQFSYEKYDNLFINSYKVLLYLIWHNPRRIIVICGSVIAIVGGLIYWNNWESSILPGPESMYSFNILAMQEWHVILGSNYANLPGLPVGIIFGYIFYKYRNTKMFTKKSHVFLWWVAVWGMSLGIILFPGMYTFSDNYVHSPLFATVYGAIGRTIFSCGIALNILGMTKGIGWMMKWTCEWYPTYVLGRLTYGAYLVHVTIMKTRGGARRSPTFLSDEMMVGEVLGDLASAYIAALILTLLFELPITALQKMMTHSNEKKELKETNGVKPKNKKVS